MSSIQSSWHHLSLAFNMATLVFCTLFCAHCLYVFLRQRQTRKHLRLHELRATMNIARQCIAAAKLSPVEITALAVEAGMKPHDVYREYVNDEQYRKEVVEAILAEMGKRMIAKYPSRFLAQGYAQQAEFVAALPPDERRRVVNTSIRLAPGIKEGEIPHEQSVVVAK